MTGLTPRKKQVIVERRKQVAAFRLAGVRNQTEIARTLGVSQDTISRDFKAVDEDFRQAATRDIIAEKGKDLDRIEDLILAVWQAAKSGQLFAIDRVVKLLERKAKMLGYDAPLTVDITERLRTEAAAIGIDPDLAVEAAQQILRDMRAQSTQAGS